MLILDCHLMTLLLDVIIPSYCDLNKCENFLDRLFDIHLEVLFFNAIFPSNKIATLRVIL